MAARAPLRSMGCQPQGREEEPAEGGSESVGLCALERRNPLKHQPQGHLELW